ncbi:nicotinate-nucleotide--dimethylbenzimidazole phosphoribosyltransferase [Streptomyces capparidis]
MSLNLDDFADLVERPDPAFPRAAEELRQRLVPRPGSLGRLEELGDWLAGVQGRCPTRPLERVRVVLFAGDHGVAGYGVSARRPGDTVRLVRDVLDGEAPVSVLARQTGAQVRVVDMSVDCDPAEFPADVTRYRVRRGSGRVDVEDALTAEEAERAFRAGMAVADEEADSGTDLVVLGDLSVGGTTVAGLLVAALSGTDASAVTGRGSGVDDFTWMRKCAAIRDGLRRARPVLGDHMALLAACGGADVAAMTGFLTQCAVRRTPVLLDGVVSAACALLTQRIAFRAPDWWQAGHSSGEPAQAKALDRLTLEPLVDHKVAYGEGVGALLALPLVKAAAGLLAELPERAAETEGAAEAEEAAPEGAAPEQAGSEEAADGVDAEKAVTDAAGPAEPERADG